jgi:hypothetical protein
VYWDTTASSLKLAYSDDLGVSWTITNWSGLYVIDHVLVSGRSYVLNKDGEVFASVDGANYTKIFDPKKDQRLNSLTEFDGKVFFAGNTSRSAFFGYFDEADQLVILRTYSTGAPYLLGFQSGITTVGDFLYFGFIQKGEFSLVRYDLDTARTILRFPGYTYVFFLNSTDEKGYFSLKSSSSNDFRYLFSISENGGVHYIADFGAYDVVCGFIRSNKYALLLASHAPYGNVTLWELNEDSYPLEATFRTEWLTLGEHVPIGLIFDFGDVGLVSTPHLPNIKVDISYDSLGSPQETVDVGAVNVARAIRLDPTADLDSPENCAMEYTMAFVPLSRDDKVRPFSVSFYFHLYSDDDTQERCPKLKGMKYVYEPVGMMSLI